MLISAEKKNFAEEVDNVNPALHFDKKSIFQTKLTNFKILNWQQSKLSRIGWYWSITILKCTSDVKAAAAASQMSKLRNSAIFCIGKHSADWDSQWEGDYIPLLLAIFEKIGWAIFFWCWQWSKTLGGQQYSFAVGNLRKNWLGNILSVLAMI